MYKSCPMSKSSQVNEKCLLANEVILGTCWIKGGKETTEETNRGATGERRKVPESSVLVIVEVEQEEKTERGMLLMMDKEIRQEVSR